RFEVTQCGEKDDGRVRSLGERSYLRADLESAHVGHADVQKYTSRALAIEGCNSLGAVRCENHPIMLVFERVASELPTGLVVVDREYRHGPAVRRFRHGTRSSG